MYPRCKKFINAWATVRSLMLLLTNWPVLNSLHCTRDLEESLKTKYKGWVHIWHENFLGVTIKIKKLLKSLNYFFPFFPSVGNHFCGISNCRTLKIFFKNFIPHIELFSFWPFLLETYRLSAQNLCRKSTVFVIRKCNLWNSCWRERRWCF